MPSSCHKCSSYITKGRRRGVKCGGSCGKLFHVKCVHISDDLYEGIKNREDNWLCDDCRSSSNLSIIVDDDLNLDSADNISLSDIMIQLKRMDLKLAALDIFQEQMSLLQSENISLKAKVLKLEQQVSVHNSKIHLMEAEMDKNNQSRNQNNIIIRGLPIQHEDHRGLIINTVSKIGVSIQADDISSIDVIRRSNKNGPTNNSTHKKVISHDFFIVKLKSTELKNNILTQMTKKKSLHTKELDVFLPQNHPEQRIFVMQHLTFFQTQLYRDAKILKTNFNFKFLWCKSGQIYLRKSTDTDVFRISSFNDIFRLQNFYAPDAPDVPDINSSR